MSIAGRTVLLKSAIDSIPTYWFSLFQIPAAIVNKLEKMRRRFLWGGKIGNGAKRTMHALSWNKLCAPKRCGGLGLKSIKLRNNILLARWAWRAYKERGSFWNEVMVSRYGRQWNYNLSLVNTKECSPIVKSIVRTHESTQLTPLIGPKSFKWILRRGDLILFWEDWWIEDMPLCLKFPSICELFSNCHVTVREFLSSWEHRTNDPNHTWPGTLPISTQESYDCFVAMLSTISLVDGDDQLVWMFDNGTFTSKACSAEIQKMNGHAICLHKEWNIIWSIKGPPKILSFLWRLQWEILPTKSFLNSRLTIITKECAWCGTYTESIPHLFWECELARWTWDSKAKDGWLALFFDWPS